MSKKLKKTFLEQLQATAKKLGGVHSYDSLIKITDGEAVYTNGFILIKGKVDSGVYENGVYRAIDMTNLGHNHYPNYSGFFSERTDIGYHIYEVIETAKLVKPYDKTTTTIGITAGGLITTEKQEGFEGSVNLVYANIAISLGLARCTRGKDKMYRFHSDDYSITMITPELKATK